MAKISEILYQAKNGLLRMPRFQRGWVWQKKHVRQLFDSLYHGFPVGSIIVWPTKGDDGQHFKGVIDGQQRLTALYSVIHGEKPPWLKDEALAAGSDLVFNVDTEKFDYSTKSRSDDLLWVGVTQLFQDPNAWFENDRIVEPGVRGKYAQRVMRLVSIKDRDITVSKLPDEITVEDAARVFKIVNRAGTKVSEGDLVLGQLCLKWPDARELVEKKLDHWGSQGFGVSTEWLLHAMAAIIGSKIEFDVLLEATSAQLQSSFDQVVDTGEKLFTRLRGELGIDRQMKTKINMGIVPVIYENYIRGTAHASLAADRRLIGWWLLGTLRYYWSFDTRNRVNRDLATIREGDSMLGLLKELRRKSPILRIQPDDFAVKRTPSQNFYRLILMLTRRRGARSLRSGVELSFKHIGDLSSLQAHHIFPVKLLRQMDTPDKQMHQVANLAFITQDDNLRIGAQSPAEYLPRLEDVNTGVLDSQWIPKNPSLWEAKAYPRFLEERRKLLAKAANDFLRDLIGEDL